MRITKEKILALPKSDLHLHLDGSMRIPTLIDFAKEFGIVLPSYTEEGLNELVFKKNYTGLLEYLAGFGYTAAVMRSPEAIERIAFELAEDCQKENVRYIEVRFAPQLHAERSSDMEWIIKAAADGLARAAARFNGRPEIVSGKELPFEYGIICCAMRTFSPGMSAYYDNLLNSLPSTPAKDVVSYASYELAASATRLRDELGLPIVGFDIAGAEAGHPAKYHRAAYRHCRRNFMGVTVHAGEAYGPESIYDAICECGAARIGHGTNLFAADAIRDEDISDRGRFCVMLAEYIARTHTTLEVCPTSNLQTNPSIVSLEKHPLGKMIEHKLSVAICTDNRLVSHTTVTDELMRVVEAFNLDVSGLRRIIGAGFKGAFFNGSYARKREYIAKAMDSFDGILDDGIPHPKL